MGHGPQRGPGSGSGSSWAACVVLARRGLDSSGRRSGGDLCVHAIIRLDREIQVGPGSPKGRQTANDGGNRSRTVALRHRWMPKLSRQRATTVDGRCSTTTTTPGSPTIAVHGGRADRDVGSATVAAHGGQSCGHSQHGGGAKQGGTPGCYASASRSGHNAAVNRSSGPDRRPSSSSSHRPTASATAQPVCSTPRNQTVRRSQSSPFGSPSSVAQVTPFGHWTGSPRSSRRPLGTVGLRTRHRLAKIGKHREKAKACRGGALPGSMDVSPSQYCPRSRCTS